MQNKLIEIPKTEIIKPTTAQIQPFSEKVIEQLTELGILPKYALRQSEPTIINIDSSCVYVTKWIRPFDSNIPNSAKKECKSFNVNVDMSTPGMYEELLLHVSSKIFSLNCNEIFTPLTTLCEIDPKETNIIQILLNNIGVICYYFPEKNSFIFGNITWHDHYISIILKHVWPQITQGLKNLGYDLNPT